MGPSLSTPGGKSTSGRRLDAFWNPVKISLQHSIPSPQRDLQTVGTVFIDVLFGVVVAKALDLSSTGQRTIAEQLNLLLAIVVTVSAWIGYHNSRNRARYTISFFNLPLFQFIIEIALVYVYWLLVVSSTRISRGTPSVADAPVLTEAILVTCYFALSSCWDLTAWAMRRTSKYSAMRIEDDRPRRRLVTRVFLLIFMTLSVIIGVAQPVGSVSTLLTVVMIIMVVMHRWVQNVVQQPVRLQESLEAEWPERNDRKGPDDV